MRTRGSSRHSSVSPSSTPRDSPSDCRKKTINWQHTAANLRRPPLKPGTLVPRRLTPEFLAVPQPPCNPRHLPPASELPSLPTYSRSPSNTTGFHRATRFRSSSSRRSAPGDSHPTPLHHDGFHSAVSTETTVHYPPSPDRTRSHRTTCDRAPTIFAEPPQIFPTESRIAATPSIVIWLG